VSRRPKNLVGMKFGRLLVISLGDPGKRKGRWWICRCDCGAERLVRTDNLEKGRTQSCGCYGRDFRGGLIEGRRPGRPPRKCEPKEQHPQPDKLSWADELYDSMADF